MSADAPQARRCSKCDVVKPLEAFSKNARNKTDGRQAKCKACFREYRQANAEQIAASARLWKEANPEAVKAQTRRYRVRYAEQLREYQREYAKNNPDMVAQKRAKRRALKRGSSHESYSRAAIFAAYNHECAYCGAAAEHLDHVVPLSRGGADAAHNLLPACAPCNLSKSAMSLAEWALTWCR